MRRRGSASDGIRKRFLTAALFQLGFGASIGLGRLFLRMVYRAGSLGANHSQFVLIDAASLSRSLLAATHLVITVVPLLAQARSQLASLRSP